MVTGRLEEAAAEAVLWWCEMYKGKRWERYVVMREV